LNNDTTQKRDSTKRKLFREKIIGVRFLGTSFGTCLGVLYGHNDICEVQRSTGDNGKMSKIRVVTPHVRPLYGTVCGDTTCFYDVNPVVRRVLCYAKLQGAYNNLAWKKGE